MDAAAIELVRMNIQRTFEQSRSQAERNRLGQFATPPTLAEQIVQLAESYLPNKQAIRFLDPAFGTGSFYSALLRKASRPIRAAAGFEIDKEHGQTWAKIWKQTPLRLKIGDFTQQPTPKAEKDKYNLLICNPPYVRHHHLTGEQKTRLQDLVARQTGIRLSGLSGLYCYFLLLTQAWMTQDGVAAWLIPTEFMEVNYGSAVKQFLTEQVELLRVHRFDSANVQFDDALVSSAVVFFRNRLPQPGSCGNISVGGSLASPRKEFSIPVRDLATAAKWTSLKKQRSEPPIPDNPLTLADAFKIKRGLATGSNEFFILDKAKCEELRIPRKWRMPILPSSRHIVADQIEANDAGEPLLERAGFLLKTNADMDTIQAESPLLAEYLRSGIDSGVSSAYLCRHRNPWYSQEDRPPAPFLCTYMSRTRTDGTLFRFLVNHSNATAANTYLMLYPTEPLAKAIGTNKQRRIQVWRALKSIHTESLVSEGRLYGGGLHKLEPKELARVRLPNVIFRLMKPYLGIQQPKKRPLRAFFT